MVAGLQVALLLLVVTSLGLSQRPPPEPSPPALQHSYDCGSRGMQLLVPPRPGQTIRFKVMDEFGNRFEVDNCSICYHWVSSEPQEPAVFSADYKGCHVLEKDGRAHLRVFVEAVLPDGRVEVAWEVVLICPKPDHTWTPTMSPFSTPSRPSLDHSFPSSLHLEHSFWLPAAAEPSLGPRPTFTTLVPVEHWQVDQPDAIGSHLPQAQCQVASGHIPCIVDRSAKEACEQVGCCYDRTKEVPCYYGNTATLQCFRNGSFTLVVSREMALAHRITLANIHLAYAPSRCPPAQKTNTFVVFHAPLTHCGTTVQVTGRQLIYENQLESDIDIQKGPQGSVTRDSSFQLHIRCIFNASDFLPIQADVFSPPSPAPVTQSGPLRLELRIAKDETFSSFYEEGDYPLVRLLREPVHVEVRLLQRTDPRLVLLLHQCWATPGANPFQQPQWPLLKDGCPFKGDSYRTQVVALDRAALPFWSHYQRFTVATFTLLDSVAQRALRGQVYFFCSASACHPSGLETCSAACRLGTARRRRSSVRPLDIVSSPGPVGFQDSAKQEPTGSGSVSSLKPLLWAALVPLAAALVLGVGVFVGLKAPVRSETQ
ncbi:zona pellucida sperm-binding protein 1 [Ochotona curzoniae]|uniref:zona pellucida sperm-binding protein 1 n=1 Tax=Ochotona curzoniae TaxID=130825 RepID=UPI001B348A09|nr:zona pellucida sperm-binding protein 1 [Ochotona curzoniae]